MSSKHGKRLQKPYLIPEMTKNSSKLAPHESNKIIRPIQGLAMLSRMNEYVQQPNDSEAYIPSLLSFKSNHPPESEAQILIQANQERIHF